MTIEDLKQFPAFMAAWPAVRNNLIEFLVRKHLSLSEKNSQDSGHTTLAKLISELEKLDGEAKLPAVRPRMPALNSMQPPPAPKSTE